MKLRYSKHFLEQYAAAPTAVRKAFDKQGALLVENFRHPSLRAKKYDDARRLWQGPVNRSWRFYFAVEGDEYILHEIRPHPK